MKNNNKTIAIFTLVEHKYVNQKYYGYAPYIFEMNMWTSHFAKVIVVGNYSHSKDLENLDSAYEHENIEFVSVPQFHIKNPVGILRLLFFLPFIIYKMVGTMRKSDYLHFRCPSNVSAIAAVVQICFPKKPKSTKYAGNWNPESDQPLGYRFQKWLLSNTFLTRRMKLLVYGQWPSKSPYIYPFISATYYNEEKVNFKKRAYSGKIKFVFIGALVVGKRPQLTIEIIKDLMAKGYDAELHMFGDGPLRGELIAFIHQHNLADAIILYGNQSKNKVKECLQDAHFTILPSKSEGWPKAIAEGMFFGAIPISTRISCLPWILDYGERGILVEANAREAAEKIETELKKGPDYLNTMAENALNWSQQYTINRLGVEIKKVIGEDF